MSDTRRLLRPRRDAPGRDPRYEEWRIGSALTARSSFRPSLSSLPRGQAPSPALSFFRAGDRIRTGDPHLGKTIAPILPTCGNGRKLPLGRAFGWSRFLAVPRCFAVSRGLAAACDLGTFVSISAHALGTFRTRSVPDWLRFNEDTPNPRLDKLLYELDKER
jgi:hypothetical protein